MSDDSHSAAHGASARPDADARGERRAPWSEWSRTLGVAVLTAAVTLTSSWLASQSSLREVELRTRGERDAAIRVERRDAYSRLLADVTAFGQSMAGCWDLQLPPTDWNPEDDAYPVLRTALQDLGTVQLIGTPEAAAAATEAYDDAQLLADECDAVRLSVAEDPAMGAVDGPLSEDWEVIMVAFDLQQASAALMSETFRADLLGTSDADLVQLKSDVSHLRDRLDEMRTSGAVPGD